MLNSLTLLLVGLALSFLLGTFITKEDILTALVNVVTLGMSFLCGVFVPLDIMGKGVKTVAHFLPVSLRHRDNSYTAAMESSYFLPLRSSVSHW